MSVVLSVLGFFWWKDLARSFSSPSPSFAFWAVQTKGLRWLFLGCGPALLSDGCPLEGDLGVTEKEDEDIDQSMISPAAAHFLGDVLSKKKREKKILSSFVIFFYAIYNFSFLPVLLATPSPASISRLCSQKGWRHFFCKDYTSVSAWNARQEGPSRIRVLPLNAVPVPKGLRLRVGRGVEGGGGRESSSERTWVGERLPGEWDRILSNRD